MTCQEAQSNITKYVNDQLDIKTLESFVDHVESCTDCMEELEVYYILLVGMKRLDEDKNQSLNFHADFLGSLTHAKAKVQRYKYQFIRRRILFVISVIFVMLVAGLSMNGSDFEEDKPYREEGESTFYLPIYYFQDHVTNLDEVVQNYLNKKTDVTDTDRSNNE